MGKRRRKTYTFLRNKIITGGNEREIGTRHCGVGGIEPLVASGCSNLCQYSFFPGKNRDSCLRIPHKGFNCG